MAFRDPVAVPVRAGGRRNLPGMVFVVWVFFITPDANGIHGEPEITGFPNFNREITLGNSP
jgi:hypothetical protein